MYAIIETGGKQFRVEEGMKVQIPELEVESGAEVTFDKVLLTADGDAIRVGRPTVEGASVKGVSLGEVKGEKLLIMKKKRRKDYMRKTGHRQSYTLVEIKSVLG
ncbi:50S ribosomal protein L21 [bacterium]|jgi:large subunit ribosomal protein L21|nr:50S ribosomal protein L21 [bacterium]MBP5627548.1 50S ribosomal protein L21 [bacterium]MBR4465212.1 50S ribosomal protein L21 [bacterium]